MTTTHRATDYTRFRQLTEHILALISGNGWMASRAHKLGWQANLLIDDCQLTLPAPTAALPPLRIAFASDFHAGPTTHPQAISAACRALHDLQPDVLLLGGDFVSLHARYIETLAKALGQIPAPLGRYAVLGNHDLWAGDAPIVRHLEQAGIQMLVNQNRQLPPPYDHIWICGLDDPTSGTPDAPAMFAGTDGERIVLMYSPEGLPFIASQPFALALCGHTHGGQICLPNGRPLWLPHGKWNRQYASGHFQIGPQPHELIVSRGVGYGGLPIRLFAPPDIVLCTITWRDQAPNEHL
jgi:predicted MPP superfamily phosphohydrolase